MSPLPKKLPGRPSSSRVAAALAAAAVAAGPLLSATAQTPPAPPAGDPFAPVSVSGDGGVPTDPARGAGPSLGPAGVSYDPVAETVEIHVSGAELTDILQMLSAQTRRNIVASREVGGTVTCNLFDVTLDQALEAILRSNGYVARAEGDFIYVYARQELAAREEALGGQETRVFRLFHVSPESAAKMVKPSLSASAVVSFSDPAAAGVGASKEDAGGDAYSGGDRLIVRDFPDNLDEIEGVLAEIDQRPEQVLIEATILSTKLSENNAFGVDFNVVGGVDFGGFTSSNGQITGGQLADNASGTPYGAGTGNNFTSPVGGGLKLGFVSNNVSGFVAALEGVTDTTVLANPKVLALNKQRGEILVGREDGYLTTTLTETVATQTVEFLKTGTKLIFRPYVSRDGFVRLEIHPEDSQGGVNAQGLPFKATTEVTSNVMVKDGRTIVIGGLFRESATTGRSQVPVLGNVPLLGALFRRQSDSTTREEIIILLTPHIVKDHDAYADLSEGELRRAEKLRVGLRKGMMPTGRERMAQANYEKAVRELASPSPDRRRALYFLDSATNLSPNFIEAIELKERVAGRVITEADQSSIRGFVRRAILEDLRGGRRDGDATSQADSAADGEGFVVRPSTRPALSYAAATEANDPEAPATRPAAEPEPTKPALWVDVKE